jgi:hypothetical protein
MVETLLQASPGLLADEFLAQLLFLTAASFNGLLLLNPVP